MNLIHIDDVKGPELALYASTSEAGLLHRFEPQKGEESEIRINNKEEKVDKKKEGL